jgi:hypothetical protein
MENREQSGAKAPSPGAREREARLRAGFEALEAATPKAVLKFADRDLAFAAYCELDAAGEDVAALADCARRMGEDPAFKSRKFPPPLETWLAKRQYRGWQAEAAARAGSAPVAVADTFDGPPELRQALVAAKGEDFARQTLDLCRFEAGPPARVIPRTGWIEQQLRKAPGVFAAHEIVLMGRA